MDDSESTRIVTKLFLANFGYDVAPARSAEEALLLFDPAMHNVIVTDNSMNGMSGAELARIIKLQSPSTPVIMYTGRPPEDTSWLDSVIQRPAHLLELRAAIEGAFA